MTEMIFQILGGIGLFLLGMVLLTDGVKAFAGQSLRQTLVQFTGTPFKAFGSGALVTTLLQSSSATTITVIGFVSAGIITFPQAVGVVIGASLGSSATGWIVSILGLKVSLGFYALPLIGVGALLRLLGSGRWRSFGLAISGFGLMFIGIETLQEGMSILSGQVDLSKLPSTRFIGPIVALALGILMTLIMQSSSASIATVLTAFHTGTLPYEKAAILVIGAAIGTTFTGALATIGGTAPAKRTALAHILFNTAAGIIALLFLPLFLMLISFFQSQFGWESGAVSLAAFHSTFILFGALLFLPFTRSFSRFIEGLLPDDGPSITRHLDDSLLQAPTVALEATRRALGQISCEFFRVLKDPTKGISEQHLRELDEAFNGIQNFFSRIPATNEDAPISDLRISQMHAIDHLTRLKARLQPNERLIVSLNHPRVMNIRSQSEKLLHDAANGLCGHSEEGWVESLQAQSAEIAKVRQTERPAILRATAQKEPTLVLDLLDAIRWLDRISYHAWRICHHLDLKSRDDLPVEPE